MGPAPEQPGDAVPFAVMLGQVVPGFLHAGGVEAGIERAAGAEDGVAAAGGVDVDHEVHDRFPFLVGHGAPGDGFGEAGGDAGGWVAEVVEAAVGHGGLSWGWEP